MYHSISHQNESHLHPYFRVSTTPERFGAQMDHLAQLGIRGVSLEEGLNYLRAESAPSQQLAIITFDDGFSDVLTSAMPRMAIHGFTATVFLPSRLIGPPRRTFNGVNCLTWPEVKDLRMQGIRFGSHSATHPKLYSLSWNKIRDEVRDSKGEIEQNLGERVTTFAYPYGYPFQDKQYTSQFERILLNAGYDCNVTTMVGLWRNSSNLLSIPRLPANDCDDDKLFQAKVLGAYDWMGVAQRLYKRFRNEKALSRT